LSCRLWLWLAAYLKNSFATINRSDGGSFNPTDPPYDPDKIKEWLGYAEGFTSG